jgi:hypothetical protein
VSFVSIAANISISPSFAILPHRSTASAGTIGIQRVQGGKANGQSFLNKPTPDFRHQVARVLNAQNAWINQRQQVVVVDEPVK